MFETYFGNVTLWIYESNTPPWKFSKNMFWLFLGSLFVLSLFVCHKCLTETEILPKGALVKNCFEKFNKFHMTSPWVSPSLVKFNLQLY